MPLKCVCVQTSQGGGECVKNPCIVELRKQILLRVPFSKVSTGFGSPFRLQMYAGHSTTGFLGSELSVVRVGARGRVVAPQPCKQSVFHESLHCCNSD